MPVRACGTRCLSCLLLVEMIVSLLAIVAHFPCWLRTF